MAHCPYKLLQMERPSTLGTGVQKSPERYGNAAGLPSFCEFIDETVSYFSRAGTSRAAHI